MKVITLLLSAIICIGCPKQQTSGSSEKVSRGKGYVFGTIQKIPSNLNVTIKLEKIKNDKIVEKKSFTIQKTNPDYITDVDFRWFLNPGQWRIASFQFKGSQSRRKKGTVSEDEIVRVNGSLTEIDPIDFTALPDKNNYIGQIKFSAFENIFSYLMVSTNKRTKIINGKYVIPKTIKVKVINKSIKDFSTLQEESSKYEKYELAVSVSPEKTDWVPFSKEVTYNLTTNSGGSGFNNNFMHQQMLKPKIPGFK